MFNWFDLMRQAQTSAALASLLILLTLRSSTFAAPA